MVRTRSAREYIAVSKAKYVTVETEIEAYRQTDGLTSGIVFLVILVTWVFLVPPGLVVVV